ncbi:hypothetical protein ACHQM5_015264 [Ranunculus cassubicifolius]
MPPKSSKSKDAPVERPILGRFSSHLKIGIVGLPRVHIPDERFDCGFISMRRTNFSSFRLKFMCIQINSSLCASRSAVSKFRSEAVYIEFMKQWNLGVYFSLRFQEIAVALDNELMVPSLTINDNPRCSTWLSAGLASRTDNTRSNPSTEWATSASPEDTELEEPYIKLVSLEKALTVKPYLYYTHLEYIERLRKLGEIEKLRAARQSMSEIYPLSPAMWQVWIRDETSLSSGDEGFDVISELYERGVRDYLSVSLWGDYINFVQERDPVARDGSPVGISKIRDLFEPAIPAAGLHVTEGARIWEAYIKFEQNVLQNIDDKLTEQKEKQLLHIRSIFQRYLSIPLQDLSSSLLAYMSWESEQGGLPKSCSNDFNGIPSHISSAYEKAMEMFKERATYEQISRQDAPTEKLQSFMSYLTFEKSSGDPARAQILYERTVTEFPVTVELWLDYTRYMDETLKVGRSVLDIHSRATRNCIWVGELWVRYLLSLERSRASEEDLSNVFEKSLLSQCISSFEEPLVSNLHVFVKKGYIKGLGHKRSRPASYACSSGSSFASTGASTTPQQTARDFIAAIGQDPSLLAELRQLIVATLSPEEIANAVATAALSQASNVQLSGDASGSRVNLDNDGGTQ